MANWTENEEITAAKLNENRGFDSRVRVKKTESQDIPAGDSAYLLFGSEDYDGRSEFDSSVKAGTASATTANHLIDTTLSPFVAGDVGKIVFNKTDTTYAIITVYNSASDVTIDSNIMANGELYRVYDSKFVAEKAGYYLIIASAKWGTTEDQKHYAIYIHLNGDISANTGVVTSKRTAASGAISGLITAVSDIQYLDVGDIIRARVLHTSVANKSISSDSYGTFLAVHRIS